MRKMFTTLLFTVLVASPLLGYAGEFEDNYAITCARYQARLADLDGGVVTPVTPTNPDANYAQNARFKYLIESEWAANINVPTGGLRIPFMHRLAPGPNAAMTAHFIQNGAPAASGQGNALYFKWTTGEYNPFAECGSAFYEHVMYDFDALAGHTIEASFWMKVDGCCVYVMPLIWLNYHNNDFEFLFSQRVLIDETMRQIKVYFEVPSGAGHTLDGERYVAFGITTHYPTAPGLTMAAIRVVK